MSNSQCFCIRLDLLGFFIINEVLLSVLGLGGDAKGIEVISCIQTFLLNYYIFFPLCVAGTGLTSNIFSLLWCVVSIYRLLQWALFVHIVITNYFNWVWLQSQSVPNECVDKFPKITLNRFYISRDFMSVLVTEICFEVNDKFQYLFWKTFT